MKKVRTLALCTLLFTGSVFADNARWLDGSVDSDFSPFVKLKLFQDPMGRQSVGMFSYTRKCVDATPTYEDVQSYRINGVLVKYQALCLGKRQRMEFPATERGIKYLVNQLRYKNSLIFERVGGNGYKTKFSAVDFYQELIKYRQ